MSGNDGNAQLVSAFLFFGVPSLIALWRVYQFPNEKQLTRWMIGHGLEVNGPGQSLVATYLQRTRRIRTVGFILGWSVVPFALVVFTGSRERLDSWPHYPFVSGVFAVAVILAEVVRPRPSPGSLSATETRLRSTYVPKFSRADLRWIALAFSVLLLVALRSGTAIVEIAALSFGAVVAWAATMAIQGWIVERPQSAFSLEELRADDAIRSTSATNAAALGYGTSTALFGYGLSLLLERDAVAGFGVISGIGTVLVVFGTLLTIGLLGVEHRWVVPRLRSKA